MITEQDGVDLLCVRRKTGPHAGEASQGELSCLLHHQTVRPTRLLRVWQEGGAVEPEQVQLQCTMALAKLNSYSLVPEQGSAGPR